jgi:filamentation induced by cAMP protein fic
MLDSIEKTSINTKKMINEIYYLMGKMKKSLKENKDINFYSKDLLEILFSHPYTKIEFVEK